MKNKFSFIIVLFAILLYAQSVSFKFTCDDTPIINRNGVTKMGFKGISTVITKDYWYGYQDSIRVPQYRPVLLVILATEWQFFKNNPAFYHVTNNVTNIVLYAFVCLLIFLLLCELSNNQNLLLPFVCTLLFTAHPIHTEVVDNVKSGDELLCFLFALLSVLFLLKSIRINRALPWFTSFLCYFLCLLSKESGITFLLIIPLILYVFAKVDIKKIVMVTGVLIAITVLYLYIRHRILEGLYFDSNNNPQWNSLYIAPDFLTQKATAIYVLLRYILLLFFPHPLTYDYSLATIPFFKITNPIVLITIIIYSALGYYAGTTILKVGSRNRSQPISAQKPIPNTQTPNSHSQLLIAFAITFYLITLFPISNLLVMIGSTMNERFLFMPSLGFTLILALFLLKIKNKRFLFVLVVIITTLYSIKTFARSRDWKDNFALFEHDVKISDNSERTHSLCGSLYWFDLYPSEKNVTLKKYYLSQSINEFTRSLDIYPNNPQVNFYLGQAYMDENDASNALKYFTVALRVSKKPNRFLFNNMGVLYLNMGQNNEAISILDSSLKYAPRFVKPYNNLACAYLALNKFQEAIFYGKKAIELAPGYARAYMNIGTAFCNMNEFDSALFYQRKAVILDSLDPLPLFNLGVTYNKMGDSAQGQYFMDKSHRIR
jgi:protein O-mannosyl-transferase